MQFQNIIWYQNTFFCCQSTEPPELQMYSNSTISTWLLVNVTAVTKIVTRLKILCWSMSSKFEVGASWESAPSFTLFTFKLQADPTAPNSSSNLAWQTKITSILFSSRSKQFLTGFSQIDFQIFSNWQPTFLILTRPSQYHQTCSSCCGQALTWRNLFHIIRAGVKTPVTKKVCYAW